MILRLVGVGSGGWMGWSLIERGGTVEAVAGC